MSTDIVVTAYRSNGGGVVSVNHSSVPRAAGSGDVNAYDNSQNTSPTAVVVQVNVSLANAANQAKAVEAANNVADTVAVIIDAAAKLPASTTIALPGGKSTTAGQLLADIKATKFVITDTKSFGNGGVGAADHTTRTDKLYFGSFVEGVEPTSYTNAGWLGQGMTGIILHEIGHLSNQGFDNFNAEKQQWTVEKTKYRTGETDFYATKYSYDNEAYSHDYAKSVASALGLPLSVYDSKAPYNTGWTGPHNVLLSNMADNGWQ